MGASRVQKLTELDGRVEKIEKRLEANKEKDVTNPPVYRIGAVVGMAKGGAIQIKDVREWGAYVVKVPYEVEPGIQDCEFMTWVDIEKARG